MSADAINKMYATIPHAFIVARTKTMFLQLGGLEFEMKYSATKVNPMQKGTRKTCVSIFAAETPATPRLRADSVQRPTTILNSMVRQARTKAPSLIKAFAL